MQPMGILVVGFAWIVMATASIRVAAGCSCAPPPPPPAGAEPSLPIPPLEGNDVAVFVGVVEEVFPKDISQYEARWEQLYHERLSDDRRSPVERLRSFILQLWPRLFSPLESERIRAAASTDELESAVGRFWLTPRRVRLRITEKFAGPQRGRLVLYTGLGGGDCGVDFKAGERWLVDAYLDDANRWIAHVCSVTLLIEEAGAVLAKLRADHR